MTTPVLNGWKEIAAFLKVSRLTAIRYYKKHGLPVTVIAGSVISSRTEIETWITQRRDTKK